MERLEGLEALLTHAVLSDHFIAPVLPHTPLLQQCDDMLTNLRSVMEEHQDAMESARKAREMRLYYKSVAKVQGRYFSVFDGATEFRIGERIERQRCHGRKAAFFVHVSAEAACISAFPVHSKMRHAPRAVLLVRADARSRPRVVHGKHTLWALTPVCEVPLTRAKTSAKSS